MTVGQHLAAKTDMKLFHNHMSIDLVWLEQDLVSSHEQYWLNSQPGELSTPHYLRINNTYIDAETAAEMIIQHIEW
ncbi:hypothetical protein [Paenibacillus dauci]|uniref:hypothetical protein n=1 Tax=Paenibacillus dauci TaxID=1567106 RepID=UPI00061981E0